MKKIGEITLEELMGEDFQVWMKKNNRFGFDLEIEGEEGFAVVQGDGIHPYAADSFAAFCRSYLHAYESAALKETA